MHRMEMLIIRYTFNPIITIIADYFLLFFDIIKVGYDETSHVRGGFSC